MESVYHIVAIHVNETSWAHVWRLRFHYLRTGYDSREKRREEGRGEVRWRVARLSLYIGAKGWRQSVIKTEKRLVINGGGNSYI
jgi:hypothetical protein